jgi:DNA-binding transcriptional ArsR family regulator
MHPFEIMAEPIRRRIVEILASGEHSAGEVVDVIRNEFGVSQPAVSRHLRILREADFVLVRIDYTSRLYRLDPDAIDQLENEVDHLRQLWDRRTGPPGRPDPLAWPTTLTLRGKGWRGAGRPPDDPWRPNRLRTARDQSPGPDLSGVDNSGVNDSRVT